MVCHHRGPCNCDEEPLEGWKFHLPPLEWWKFLTNVCVTVASVRILGIDPWTTIFTAYFIATAWLEWFNGPGRQEPDIVATVAMLIIVPPFAGFLITRMLQVVFLVPWAKMPMSISTFADGWLLTFYIIILTRCFIGMYEGVRPYLIEELLSQEKKKKRQRELRGGGVGVAGAADVYTSL